MLFNLDWLERGKLFPPRTEIPRLKQYVDNDKLFNDEGYIVLKPYVERLKEVIGGISDTPKLRDNMFFQMPNYWQLTTLKTGDLAIGEKPTITVDDSHMKTWIDNANNSSFDEKLFEIIYDIDSKGDSIARVYIDESGNRNFVVQDPQMWFPVINPENRKDIKQHCIAWIVNTYQDATSPLKNKYELYVQIHTKDSSKYEFRRYAIDKHFYQEYILQETNENFGNVHWFTIGELKEQKIIDGGIANAIIHFSGVTTSKSPFGISNYDRITEIVAEIGIREALGAFILDQNSAPRMAAPSSAFIQNAEGQWVLKTGGRSFVVAPGEQSPVYITWDGNLTSNAETIQRLKQDLYSLSEMGAIINNDEMNSTQGFEALEVKMTNPRLKIRRLCTKINRPMRELISRLADTEVKNVSVMFNDGIPVTESQNITNATNKKALGISTNKVLQEYFNYTPEQAEEEIERAKEESPGGFVDLMGIGQNSLYNDTEGGNI